MTKIKYRKKSKKNQIRIEFISNSKNDVNRGCFKRDLKLATSEKYSSLWVSTFPEPEGVNSWLPAVASMFFFAILESIDAVFIAVHASIAFRSRWNIFSVMIIVTYLSFFNN